MKIQNWLPPLALDSSLCASTISEVYSSLYSMSDIDFSDTELNINTLTPEDLVWNEYKGKLVKSFTDINWFLISPDSPYWQAEWMERIVPARIVISKIANGLKAQGMTKEDLGCVIEVNPDLEDVAQLSLALKTEKRLAFVKTYTGYSPLYLLTALLTQPNNSNLMGRRFRNRLAKLKDWEVSHLIKSTEILRIIQDTEVLDVAS